MMKEVRTPEMSCVNYSDNRLHPTNYLITLCFYECLRNLKLVNVKNIYAALDYSQAKAMFTNVTIHTQ